MQAYRDALPADTTSVVLSPDSEFFHYFGQAQSAPAAPAAARRRR